MIEFDAEAFLKTKIEKFTKDFQSALYNLKFDVEQTFNVVFHEFPELYKISWVQYTSYYNDGDECTFQCYGKDEFEFECDIAENTSVYNQIGDICFSRLAKSYEEALVHKWNPLPATITKEKYDNICALCVFISTLLCSIPDDVIKNMFGDHVEVTVTREGIVSEFHEHE